MFFASPAVFACEWCYSVGQTDPVGNVVTGQGKCWSGVANGYATCIPSGSSCTKSTDTTCKGGGGGGIRHKDFLRAGDIEPVVTDCTVDVSGSCTTGRTLRDSFLN